MKRIKERVEEKEGIPPQQQAYIVQLNWIYINENNMEMCVAQRLIFGGKQMHDDKTASDYNLEVIYLSEIKCKLSSFISYTIVWCLAVIILCVCAGRIYIAFGACPARRVISLGLRQ